MDDDFNTAGGLAAIFALVTAANSYLSASGSNAAVAVVLRSSDMLVELCDVLGIDVSHEDTGEELPEELIDLARAQASFEGDSANEAAAALLRAREEARAQKDWKRADAIRDGISSLGLIVEDTAAGVRLRAKKSQ